jgi:hypothetical protein
MAKHNLLTQAVLVAMLPYPRNFRTIAPTMLE